MFVIVRLVDDATALCCDLRKSYITGVARRLFVHAPIDMTLIDSKHAMGDPTAAVCPTQWQSCECES